MMIDRHHGLLCTPSTHSNHQVIQTVCRTEDNIFKRFSQLPPRLLRAGLQVPGPTPGGDSHPLLLPVWGPSHSCTWGILPVQLCCAGTEDGFFEFCRWCANGGDLLCCDSCSNAFCKKCIKGNLRRTKVTEKERAASSWSTRGRSAAARSLRRGWLRDTRGTATTTAWLLTARS